MNQMSSLHHPRISKIPDQESIHKSNDINNIIVSRERQWKQNWSKIQDVPYKCEELLV
jgi:hypothetical protein